MFALFSSPDHADRFKEYLSFKHPNINFSIEKENDDCLPFLDDTNIDLQLTSIEKRLYRKVYTNFKSLIGLIILLLFRCLSLCSDFIKFHHEIDKLKSIFYRKSYPRDLIGKCIKEFLVKIQAPKPEVSTVPKRNF